MKVRKYFFRFVLIVPIFLIGGQNAFTQQNGTLKGQIFDLAETGIPWARVTVGSDGQKYETTTNKDGKYEITLPAGTYLLVVRSDGFLPSQERQIKILAGQTTEINLTMRITREVIGCLTPLPEAKGEAKEQDTTGKKKP